MSLVGLIIVTLAGVGSQLPDQTSTLALQAELDARQPTGWAGALISHPAVTHLPEGGPDGRGAIRVAYVGGPMGSQRVVVGYPLPEPLTHATLCYDVMFEEGFDFARGGKLHGLGPARPVTGGNPMRPDGWSSRVMFRAQGGLMTYVYHQDQPGRYGQTRHAEQFRFVTGRFYSVSIHTVLNSTPDTADGFVHVYVDGRRVVSHDQLRLAGQMDPQTLIRRALFSTFHGGNSPDWAPKDADGNYRTVHARFANLEVHRGLHVRPGRD